MSQSAILGGALAAMFIIYLAMNGRLQLYWALLTGGSSAPRTASGGVQTGASTPGQQPGGTTTFFSSPFSAFTTPSQTTAPGSNIVIPYGSSITDVPSGGGR